MPLVHSYDSTTQVLWVKVAKTITALEIEAMIAERGTTEEHALDVDTIWDLDDYDFSSTSRGVLERFIQGRKRFPDRIAARTVLVAPSDLGYGMCRMYHLMSEIHQTAADGRMHVCRTTGEAIVWLLAHRRSSLDS